MVAVKSKMTKTDGHGTVFDEYISCLGIARMQRPISCPTSNRCSGREMILIIQNKKVNFKNKSLKGLLFEIIKFAR